MRYLLRTDLADLAGATPSASLAFAGDAACHSVLPAITIIISVLGGWVISMRNNMIAVLGSDYVTFAEANGLRPRTVALRYAARNALLPNMTLFALALGLVVSGPVLTEYVFGYPGIGYLLGKLRTERGVSLLYITHDLLGARAVTSSVLVLSNGRVVEQGSARDVLMAPSHPYTRPLLAALPSPFAAGDYGSPAGPGDTPGRQSDQPPQPPQGGSS